tara:strand:+ start:237 stop:647 length:411 start_codon:yes stop_codon:yes gene_type:complete
MDLEIINIASDTDNNRDIRNHTHFSKLKNSLCGDEIQIKLIIKENKIVDFGYQGQSCIYCQASASLLSKISINSSVKKIDKLCGDAKFFFDGNLKIIDSKWKLFKTLFRKKNLYRKNCILLPFKTLKKIVSNLNNE